MNLFNLQAKIVLDDKEYSVKIHDVATQTEVAGKRMEKSLDKTSLKWTELSSKLQLISRLFKKSLAMFGLGDEFQDWTTEFQDVMQGLINNDFGAEKRLDDFITYTVNKVTEMIPVLVRVLTQVLVGIAKQLPYMTDQIINSLFEIDWLQVGWDIGKSVVTGLGKALWGVLKKIAGEGWLWGENSTPTISNYTYRTIEQTPNTFSNSKQTIDVNVNASGDTALSEENAKKVADELKEYLNKSFGADL